MSLINFHTHLHSSKSKVIAIQCIDIDNSAVIEKERFYSIGIHPWSANNSYLQEKISQLEPFLLNSNVIALGEIGLDKIKGPSIDIQKKVFTSQIEIAYTHNKPIIIHCVRAWHDLLEIKKNYPNTLPWVIHGFNGNEQLVKQLVEKGFYLSVGHSVLNNNSKISKSITCIPINKLFLETDDSEIAIDEIYQETAKKISMQFNDLEAQLYSNFRELYANCSTSKNLIATHLKF
jgi:TatD DNase family protein